MADYEMRFNVDNEPISLADIEKIEKADYHQVFDAFYQKNIDVKLDNKILFQVEANAISLDNARLALAQTKRDLGQERLSQLLEPQIEKSDHKWHSTLNNYQAHQPLKHHGIDIQVDNLSVLSLLMFNRNVRNNDVIYFASLINPNYYYLKVEDSYDPYIVAGTGTKGLPTYFYTKSFDHHDYPIGREDGMDLIIYKRAYLADDDTNTHIECIIQLGQVKNGFKLNVDLYAPDCIPQREINTYKNRILVSIKNIIQIAAKEKINPVQKLFLSRVYSKMKNN